MLIFISLLPILTLCNFARFSKSCDKCYRNCSRAYPMLLLPTEHNSLHRWKLEAFLKMSAPTP